MTHPIAAQQPTVALGRRYAHFLAIAVVALVSLTFAVVVVATSSGGRISPSPKFPTIAPAQTATSYRYDGGPDEGTRAPLTLPSTRDDAGPKSARGVPGR
jgi:hypothetical protein